MSHPRTVAILVFDGVEVLDFAGPFEVFSTAMRPGGDGRSVPAFDVFTVAPRAGPVAARGGLSVNPARVLQDCPCPDVLVVPGGPGVRALVDDGAVVGWIGACAAGAGVVASVCTGVLLLAKAGLLAGRGATTHFLAFDELRRLAPGAILHGGARFVDSGGIVTSAGVSAGIDMSLHLLRRFVGEGAAVGTAERMEYRWDRGDGSAGARLAPAPAP